MNTIINSELTHLLNKWGAEIIKFVDTTSLPYSRTNGFPKAILLGKPLSSGYLEKVTNTPDYVQEMKRTKRMYEDEFHNTELKTDELADFITQWLVVKGYKAFSQSEKNLLATGTYNTAGQTTRLPHKTIALLAGMGWIGRHDLLVNPEYGSAISMCTVLTNAPLQTEPYAEVSSECNNCNVCVEICPENAIKGTSWSPGVERDKMVNVKNCTTCLRCMVLCPWTQQYIKKESGSELLKG